MVRFTYTPHLIGSVSEMHKPNPVACLYRVSTPSQLSDGDIPLQQNACHAFAAEREGWQIVAEYMERGVSGYHKTASERDVLLAIHRDAEYGLFKVLLVYSFDRLGRREDETPFVASWLTERGIAVWSVVEGLYMAACPTDRLVNYIRFWQAGSESVATSLRVAEKHRQMVRDGLYRGGPPPFGYRLIPSGRISSKGRICHKLVIDPPESATVQLMYKLENEHNIGCYSVARILNERNLFTRNGHLWTSPAVVRTLRNPIYKGDYVAGRQVNQRDKRTKQNKNQWTHAREPLTDLAIVDADVWRLVNERIDARHRKSHRNEAKKLLLLDIARCGYCGCRLASGGKHTRYDCSRRMRQDKCTGAFGYSAAKTEHVVWCEIERLMRYAEATWGLVSAARQEALQYAKTQAQYLSLEYKKLSSHIADALSHGADSEEALALSQRMVEVEQALKKTEQITEEMINSMVFNRREWLIFLVKQIDISRGGVAIWFNDTVRGRTSGVPGRQFL